MRSTLQHHKRYRRSFQEYKKCWYYCPTNIFWKSYYNSILEEHIERRKSVSTANALKLVAYFSCDVTVKKSVQNYQILAFDEVGEKRKL